ncbi:TPM domain-containing protein [Patescibacteria group bacterium]|nr:TPM domain-containing protein [Patescibacteria group bacterium]
MRAWLRGVGLLASLASAFLLSGEVRSVYAYTSPGPALGYVSDFAGVLSQDAISEMTTLIRAHEASSSQEIAVVTIPRLDDETVETYAVALFKEWGIGKRADNNGVLILVAVEDRKVRIEVGYGLEPVLTDALSAGLINRVLPLFKASDYNGATRELTKGTIGILNSDPTSLFPERSSGGVLIDDSSPWPIKLFFWFSIFVLFGGGMLFVGVLIYAYFRLSKMAFFRHKTPKGTIFTTSTSSRSSDWSPGSSNDSSSSSSGSFGGGSSGGGGASGSW